MDQARLAQEYANLSSVYDPQKALIQQQISALPQQYEGQKSALEQAKINAFRNIGEAAQTRGTFFSGFRPQEMARYTGEKYLPALANLGTQQQQATFNLQKALADVELAQRQAATTNLQNILNREQQQRQFEQSLAAQRSAGGGGGYGGGPTFGGGGEQPTGGGQPAPGASGLPEWRPVGKTGNAFYDSRGNPISAVKYSQIVGKPFAQLLQDMADAGDANAQIAIKYVGNNFTNVPQQYKAALQTLGVGSATYAKPGQAAKPSGFTSVFRPISSFR